MFKKRNCEASKTDTRLSWMPQLVPDVSSAFQVTLLYPPHRHKHIAVQALPDLALEFYGRCGVSPKLAYNVGCSCEYTYLIDAMLRYYRLQRGFNTQGQTVLVNRKFIWTQNLLYLIPRSHYRRIFSLCVLSKWPAARRKEQAPQRGVIPYW